MPNNCERLMVFLRFLRKTVEKLNGANCNGKKTLINSRSFQQLLVNNGVEMSSSLGLILSKNLWATRVYHVEFRQAFFKELEVKTVQFLGRNCIFSGRFCFTNWRHLTPSQLLHCVLSGLFSSFLLYFEILIFLCFDYLRNVDILLLLCRLFCRSLVLLEVTTWLLFFPSENNAFSARPSATFVQNRSSGVEIA